MQGVPHAHRPLQVKRMHSFGAVAGALRERVHIDVWMT